MKFNINWSSKKPTIHQTNVKLSIWLFCTEPIKEQEFFTYFSSHLLYFSEVRFAGLSISCCVNMNMNILLFCPFLQVETVLVCYIVLVFFICLTLFPICLDCLAEVGWRFLGEFIRTDECWPFVITQPCVIVFKYNITQFSLHFLYSVWHPDTFICLAYPYLQDTILYWYPILNGYLKDKVSVYPTSPYLLFSEFYQLSKFQLKKC